MSDDSVDFGLDLHGNTGEVARKMAADLKRFDDALQRVNRTHSATERAFARSRAFTPQQFRDLQNHANAVVRLQKSHRQLAPAAGMASRALRTFGVSGRTLRTFAIDAAKSEIALRRLYRLKGGGFGGAMGAAEMMVRRSGIRGRAASAIGSGAMSLAGTAGTGAMIAGGATAVGVGLMATSMASTVIEAERVRFALDAITNGQGAEWWATSADYAKRFGLNVNTVADNLMNMKASGFTDDMTKTLFLRMGDLRSLGATEETIGRALLAIRQVQAAGRLQGDELNQLSEAGINANYIYSELSKTLGKTTPEIIKMKEAGQLSADIVIPAIANAIGAKTGGKGAGEAGEAAAMGTVIGQWGRLKGAFSVASTQAIGSEALAPLRTAIENFTAWVSGPGGQATIGAFGGMLSRVFEAAPAIVEKVIWFFEVGLPEAWDAFKTSFTGYSGLEQFLSSASTLNDSTGPGAIDTMRAIGDAAGKVADALMILGQIAEGAARAVSWVWHLMDGVPILGTPINELFGSAPSNDTTVGAKTVMSPAVPVTGAGAAQMSMTAANDWFGVGQSMSAGLEQGMLYGAPGVSAAAAFLGQTAEGALRTQQEVHSPGRKMMAVGAGLSSGVELGMQQGIPRIEDVSRSMGTAVTRGATSAESPSTNIGGVTVQIFVDGSEVRGKSGDELADLLKDKLESSLTRTFRRLAS